MDIPSGWTVLSFSSHRSRDRSGVAGRVSRGGDPIRGYDALYSFRRGSTGGYYLVPDKKAQEVIILLKGKGVSKLRGPYDDLRKRWSGE